MTAEIDVAVWHDEVVMHVPPDVAERARKVAPDNGVDLLVPVGGGSTTGLAKAVSLTTGIPSIAVASTYVGSEATVFGPFFVEGDPRTEIGDSVFSVKESLIKKFVRHDSGTPTPGGWDVSTIGDGLSEIPADGVAQ